MSGSTAICGFVSSSHFVIANLGDSRCVLSRNGQASPLSVDHKPALVLPSFPSHRKGIREKTNLRRRRLRSEQPRKWRFSGVAFVRRFHLQTEQIAVSDRAAGVVRAGHPRDRSRPFGQLFDLRVRRDLGRFPPRRADSGDERAAGGR